MAGELRVGLIGLNERAERLLIPGLRGATRGTLRAVCSRDPAKAARVAAALGADVLGFGGADALVQSGAVDAVYVNTPLDSHAPVCRAALAAGCAVICEKPLATTTAEAIELAALARHRRLGTVVNFTYRSLPAFRLTERWLQHVGTGRPLHAEFALLQGHNFLPGFVPGSALLDSGVHLFDVVLALCAAAGLGPVTAVLGAPLRPESVPDYGWTWLGRTIQGTTVSASFSRSAMGWRNGLRWGLYGETAAIEVQTDGGWVQAREARRGDGRAQGTWRALSVEDDLLADDTRFAAFHMDRLLAGVLGACWFPDFEWAVDTQRLADALAESATRGSWAAVEGAAGGATAWAQKEAGG